MGSDDMNDKRFEELHRPRIKTRLEERLERYDRVVKYLEIHGSSYSVDVSNGLGIKVSTAAGILRSLEGAGLLESTLEESPISGNGRRYYKLKGKQ